MRDLKGGRGAVVKGRVVEGSVKEERNGEKMRMREVVGE